jgi:mannose-6-phosphate isomerase-like protein (cupin superfamily)
MIHFVPFLGGEVIGDSPDRRVEILYEHDALHATWSRFGPGRDGADLHVHLRHHDTFYVLTGHLLLRLRDSERVADAGTIACVPPGVVHGFRNASDTDELQYLNFHAPGVGFASYLRGLRDGVKVTYDQFDPPPGGGADPAGVILGTELHLPQLTVDHDPPAGPSERLESFYDLDRQTWVSIPPGDSHALSTRGRYVHVSAQL